MDRTDAAIIVLSMSAAGIVIAAPLIGRLGAPFWADVAMACAVACGLGATAAAALHTIRAARRARSVSAPASHSSGDGEETDA